MLVTFVRPKMGYVRAWIGLTEQFDRRQPWNYLQPCINVKMCPLPFFFCWKFDAQVKCSGMKCVKNWKFAVFPHQESFEGIKGLLLPLLNTSTVNNYYYMYHFAWCYFFSCFLLKRGFHAKLRWNKESYSTALVLVSSIIIRLYNARMTA